jgi:hypothetical protein
MFEELGELSPERKKTMEKLHDQGIEDQISRADLEEINDILTNISEAVLENPNLVKNPEARKKIDAASKRFKELVGITSGNETIH